MQNIVFLDRQSLRAELRAPSFAHAWTEHVQTRPDQVVERLQHATVAITNKVPIRRDTLAQLPNLKLIAMAATGYDVIDVDACRERGVAVAEGVPVGDGVGDPVALALAVGGGVALPLALALPVALPTRVYVIAPLPPLTEPTSVPLAVSPVLPGSLPVTVPGARSWPSWFRSRAFS